MSSFEISYFSWGESNGEFSFMLSLRIGLDWLNLFFSDLRQEIQREVNSGMGRSDFFDVHYVDSDESDRLRSYVAGFVSRQHHFSENEFTNFLSDRLQSITISELSWPDDADFRYWRSVDDPISPSPDCDIKFSYEYTAKPSKFPAPEHFIQLQDVSQVDSDYEDELCNFIETLKLVKKESSESELSGEQCPVDGCEERIGSRAVLYDHCLGKHGFWDDRFAKQINLNIEDSSRTYRPRSGSLRINACGDCAPCGNCGCSCKARLGSRKPLPQGAANDGE